jgi:hypothetical protein
MAKLDVIDFTPVLDTSQYAQHDVLWVAKEIPGFFNDPVTPRRLTSVVGVDEDDENVTFELLFFNADVTLGTLNGAINITDADMRKYLGSVVLVTADMTDTINSRGYFRGSINLILKGSGLSTSVWCAGVLRSASTPTYATASDIKLKLGVE